MAGRIIAILHMRAYSRQSVIVAIKIEDGDHGPASGGVRSSEAH
jgi:hypothetical protein